MSGECTGCQPCTGCGHHVPKARIPALCEQCARPPAPAIVHAGEWRLALADVAAARPAAGDTHTDRERLREAVAEVETRHSVLIKTNALVNYLKCSCGWFGGQLTRESGGMAGARERGRLHRADAVLALPEVAALLDAAEKVQRWARQAGPDLDFDLAEGYRRALDGDAS